MKKILFILFCCCGTLLANAQTNLIFKIGGGLSSHYGNGAKAIGSFKIGVGYEIEMNGMWSLEPGLVFYSKGWKDHNQEVYKYDEQGNVLYDDNNQPLTGIMNTSSRANYLEIPILFNFFKETSPQQYLVFSAGPYIAYGIGGKMTTKGDTQASGAERYFYAENTFKERGTHRLDAGIQASIGYEFTSKLSVGIESDFGLLNFNQDGAKNIAILASFAYRLPL